MMPLEWTYDEVIQLVQEHLPVPLSAEIDEEEEMACIHLPIPDEADYSVVVYIYAHECLQFSASLIDYPKLDFWHTDFELCSGEGIEVLTDQFIEILETLLHYPTVIVQKNGWFCCHFSPFALIDGGREAIPGVSYLKTNFKFPPIEGKKKTYTSPPLLSVGAGSPIQEGA